MKYKLLLTGNNKELIYSFFAQMSETFECMSSSTAYDDLSSHLHYFSPHAVVYCPKEETRNGIASVSNIRDELSSQNIPYVVVAGIGDYSEIERMAAGNSKLILKLPLSTMMIQNSIVDFLCSEDPSLGQANAGALDMSTGDSTLDMLAHVNAEMSGMDIESVASAARAATRLNLEPEYGGRHRILVIDDSTIVHRTIKSFLDVKYEVATAINGKVAMRYLKSKAVSLILLDYEMPNINGPELLVKIREYPDLTNIPVIFLTCINDVEKIQKALALKPQGYLLKPVEKDALIKKINELID